MSLIADSYKPDVHEQPSSDVAEVLKPGRASVQGWLIMRFCSTCTRFASALVAFLHLTVCLLIHHKADVSDGMHIQARGRIIS